MGLKLSMEIGDKKLLMENPSEKMEEPKNGNNCHFLVAIFYSESPVSTTAFFSLTYRPSDKNVRYIDSAVIVTMNRKEKRKGISSY